MSFSFNITATTKDEAKEKVGDELDKVVANQPVHAADRDAAQGAAYAFIDLLSDPAEGEEIRVGVHGSVGWQAEGEFTHSSFGVNAHRAQRG